MRLSVIIECVTLYRLTVNPGNPVRKGWGNHEYYYGALTFARIGNHLVTSYRGPMYSHRLPEALVPFIDSVEIRSPRRADCVLWSNANVQSFARGYELVTSGRDLQAVRAHHEAIVCGRRPVDCSR